MRLLQEIYRHHPLTASLLPTTAVMFLGVFFIATPLQAQESDDLQLFGSMQTVFFHEEARMELSFPARGISISQSESRNTFALQQMDLFLRKEIGQDFTAFVDLEFQLNYASDMNWGSLSLQEAWMNYHYSDAFNIKTGLLFPAFNQLNEVKNRLALHPYLFRPLIYERLLAKKFYAEDFIPEHAFVQIHGAIPWGDFFADYAVYTGNAESTYLTRSNPEGGIESDVNNNFEFLSGVDPTDIKFKLFGGRIGLRTRDEQMKCGLSITHDYNNLRDTARYPSYIVSTSARELLGGDAPRYRLGADYSMKYGPFFIEAELIKVLYHYERAEEHNVQIHQQFFHSMIGYDLLDALTVFGSMQWGDYTFGVDSDYFVYSVGGAFRVNSSISAKAQFIVYDESFDFKPTNDLDRFEQRLTITFLFVGFSVLL